MKKNVMLSVLVLGMFIFSFANVSASISYSEGNQTYKIDTWVPDWLGGKGESTVTLLENTDHCLINCGFHLSGYNEKELNLVDDIEFLDKEGNDVSEKLKSINFQLGTYQYVEKYNTTYETVCEEVFLNNTNLTNLTKQCYQELKSNETYYINELVWEDYKGQKVSGYWELKAEAKKNPVSTDWVITFRDKELSKWAWWNSNWEHKRQINLTASVGDFFYSVFGLDWSNKLLLKYGLMLVFGMIVFGVVFFIPFRIYTEIKDSMGSQEEYYNG